MSTSQSDKDIALTSKRINMALDEFIKESKNEKKNNHAKHNRAAGKKLNVKTGGNNQGIAKKPQHNHNNNQTKDIKVNISSPKVKKTLSVTSPKKQTNVSNKLANVENFKIQIKNDRAVSAPKTFTQAKPIARITRSKLTIGKRVNITRNTNNIKPTGGAVRSFSNGRNNDRNNQQPQQQSTRIVQRYDNNKQTSNNSTLNARFSKN